MLPPDPPLPAASPVPRDPPVSPVPRDPPVSPLPVPPLPVSRCQALPMSPVQPQANRAAEHTPPATPCIRKLRFTRAISCQRVARRSGGAPAVSDANVGAQSSEPRSAMELVLSKPRTHTPLAAAHAPPLWAPQSEWRCPALDL